MCERCDRIKQRGDDLVMATTNAVNTWEAEYKAEGKCPAHLMLECCVLLALYTQEFNPKLAAKLITLAATCAASAAEFEIENEELTMKGVN
jgi:hypothetical protein